MAATRHASGRPAGHTFTTPDTSIARSETRHDRIDSNRCARPEDARTRVNIAV
jgi:hypothetical protein